MEGILLFTLLNNQHKLQELIMAVKDDLNKFKTDLDAALGKVSTKVSDLQSQIAAGTISSAELSAALQPIIDGLNAIAAGNAAPPPPPPPL